MIAQHVQLTVKENPEWTHVSVYVMTALKNASSAMQIVKPIQQTCQNRYKPALRLARLVPANAKSTTMKAVKNVQQLVALVLKNAKAWQHKNQF
ncbi:MAG: hypothetical protein M3R27_09895 [Bacteroidota bacterium]|nr:hypothetical protein [Bacteroidota bacterium]